MAPSAVNILVVDDDPADIILAEECFKRTSYPVTLHHVVDGEQCLAFLRKEGRYPDAPTPDLILLDVNMPRMTGHQVMAEIMADERLCHLPIVVLTTSASEVDVMSMLQRRCNSYIVKPHDLSAFQKVAQGLCDYWFGLPGLVPASKVGSP